VEPAQSRHRSPMKATLELTAWMIDLEAEDTETSCPLCDQVLNLHQPDENMPTQLLATCDCCLRWYALFAISEDSNQFLMLDLPDKSVIDKAHFRNGLEDRE
jgi:hypothetical protein